MNSIGGGVKPINGGLNSAGERMHSVGGSEQGTKSSESGGRAFRDDQEINVLLGSYADILFVLLPFTVIALFRLWQEGLQAVLSSYDISAASAVLAGLALVKFILGLLSDSRMSRYRERLVFLVAGTVFIVLMPSLMLCILVMLSDPTPRFVIFVQPILLIAAIMAYSGAVTSTNHLLRTS